MNVALRCLGSERYRIEASRARIVCLIKAATLALIFQREKMQRVFECLAWDYGMIEKAYNDGWFDLDFISRYRMFSSLESCIAEV